MLVADVASGAAPELDRLRAACEEAVRRMHVADVSAVMVLAGAANTRGYAPGSGGDFARYGVPGVSAVLGGAPGVGTGRLPLGLLVGAWLLARHDHATRCYGQAIDTTASPAACLRLGRALDAGDGPRVGLLVMGDGSACRSDRAPGAYQPDAEGFDQAVAAALDTADTQVLRDLDPEVSERLMVAGRVPWQVLAGAAGDGRWRSELLYHDAPYGVGYFVASWRAA
jgi:hypothetical protein